MGLGSEGRSSHIDSAHSRCSWSAAGSSTPSRRDRPRRMSNSAGADVLTSFAGPASALRGQVSPGARAVPSMNRAVEPHTPQPRSRHVVPCRTAVVRDDRYSRDVVGASVVEVFRAQLLPIGRRGERAAAAPHLHGLAWCPRTECGGPDPSTEPVGNGARGLRRLGLSQRTTAAVLPRAAAPRPGGQALRSAACHRCTVPSPVRRLDHPAHESGGRVHKRRRPPHRNVLNSPRG